MKSTFDFGASDRNQKSTDHPVKSQTRAQRRARGSELARNHARLNLPKANKNDVTWFVSQLSIMIETGIPISEALSSLSERCERRSTRKLFMHIANDVEHGKSLSIAMEQAPARIDEGLIALVQSGEESGNLGTILTKAHEYMSQEMLLMKRFKSAMMYPALMVVVCVSVVLMLMLFVLPRFATLFEGKGAQLPTPTRVLMGMSDHLAVHWFWWLFALSAGLIGLNMWMATKVGSSIRDRVVLGIPLIGKTLNTLYQARAFRGFAVMLEAGVPITQSVEIAGKIVANKVHKDLWVDVASRTNHGERLSGAFADSPVIPNHIAQMIESGDQAGRLGFVFDRLAGYLEKDYELSIKGLIQVIEPLMIAIMGVLVGFIAAALMLPLFQAGGVMSS
tara:strand:+ start:57291 stop:58466 length:1176 start_codon:yes stop_codon:yes gene_type:complete